MPKRPSDLHCAAAAASMCIAIDRICDAWPLALEEQAAYGWPSHSPGFGERGYLRRVQIDENGNVIPPDPDDLPPANSDPTGTIAAIVPDKATRWLRECERTIRVVIALTPAEAPGERRWTGRSTIPQLRMTAKIAARDLTDLWPIKVTGIIERLVRLGNVAVKEWPPTPQAGAIVDGIKVGGRYSELATCAECQHPIVVGDQVDNYQERTYHRRPCGHTVRERARRQAR